MSTLFKSMISLSGFNGFSSHLFCILCIFGLLFLIPVEACCSLWPARFSDTRGYVAEAMMKGQRVHLLGYSNRAKNLAIKGGKTRGNAMFLPIPAVPGTMSEQNLLDMSKAKNVLKDMELSLNKNWQWQRRGDTKALFTLSPEVQVFEHGVYTIVLAQRPSAIPLALSRVPERKRPMLNPKIFEAYEKWYPKWTFALCCFDNKDSKDAEPMLWWYQSMFPQVLFFPALDCHTGAVPDLKATVDVDHFLAASSPELDLLRNSKEDPDELGKVFYTDSAIPPAVKQLLPKNVIGTTMKGDFEQGDFLVNVNDVREGAFIVRRVLPPGVFAEDQNYNFKDLLRATTFQNKK